MKSPLVLLFAASLIGVLTDPPATTAHQKSTTMKINPGIVTEKLNESKAFYQNILGFGVSFENEFYVLMHTPDGSQEISLLLPDHPSQQKIFQSRYEGKGMYLTIEVPDVDEVYKSIKAKGVKIEVELRNEPWGDRHFAFYDPNGVGIDIITYKKPD